MPMKSALVGAIMAMYAAMMPDAKPAAVYDSSVDQSRQAVYNAGLSIDSKLQLVQSNPAIRSYAKGTQEFRDIYADLMGIVEQSKSGVQIESLIALEPSDNAYEKIVDNNPIAINGEPKKVWTYWFLKDKVNGQNPLLVRGYDVTQVVKGDNMNTIYLKTSPFEIVYITKNQTRRLVDSNGEVGFDQAIIDDSVMHYGDFLRKMWIVTPYLLNQIFDVESPGKLPKNPREKNAPALIQSKSI